MQFRNKESPAKERIANATPVGSGYLRSSAIESTSAAGLAQVNALHVQRTTRPRRRDWRGFLVLATSARLVIRRLESQPPQRTVRHVFVACLSFLRGHPQSLPRCGGRGLPVLSSLACLSFLLSFLPGLPVLSSWLACPFSCPFSLACLSFPLSFPPIVALRPAETLTILPIHVTPLHRS
jgi:hypothetical protein